MCQAGRQNGPKCPEGQPQMTQIVETGRLFDYNNGKQERQGG